MAAAVGAEPLRVIGRYALYGEIASGGMATVHLGRLLGPVGFTRIVAIKRLHRQYAKDPRFVSMFVDEARLAARIQHPNVVQTLDVVQTEDELFHVMEYVHGVSMSALQRETKKTRPPGVPPGGLPLDILASIVIGMLHGLHAAHEAKTEKGEPLHIVHRDVSPQNVLVGVDGIARVIDFGVAKAAGRLQNNTQSGQLKGKLAYMAPEQLMEKSVTRRSDVYAAAVVLWEGLTGRLLFDGENQAIVFGKVLRGEIEPPSAVVKSVPRALDAVVMRGLAHDPADRYPTARDFAVSLERCVQPANATLLGGWTESAAHQVLVKRAAQVSEVERATATISMVGSDGVSSHRGSRPSINGRTEDVVAAVAAAAAAGDLARMPQASEILVDGDTIAGPRRGSSPSHAGARPGSSPRVSRPPMPSSGEAGATRVAPLMAPMPDDAASSVISGVSLMDGMAGGPPDAVPEEGGGRRALVIAAVSGVLALLIVVALVRVREMESHAAPPVDPATIPTDSTTAPIAAPTLTAPAFDDPAVDPNAAVSAQPLQPTAPLATGPTTVLGPMTGPIDTAPAPQPVAPVRRPKPTRAPSTGGGSDKPSKASCDPPYTRDPSGVKIYKPECVE